MPQKPEAGTVAPGEVTRRGLLALRLPGMEVPGPPVSGRPAETSVKWQLCYDMTAKMWWMVSAEVAAAGGGGQGWPGGDFALGAPPGPPGQPRPLRGVRGGQRPSSRGTAGFCGRHSAEDPEVSSDGQRGHWVGDSVAGLGHPGSAEPRLPLSQRLPWAAGRWRGVPGFSRGSRSLRPVLCDLCQAPARL